MATKGEAATRGSTRAGRQILSRQRRPAVNRGQRVAARPGVGDELALEGAWRLRQSRRRHQQQYENALHKGLRGQGADEDMAPAAGKWRSTVLRPGGRYASQEKTPLSQDTRAGAMGPLSKDCHGPDQHPHRFAGRHADMLTLRAASAARCCWAFAGRRTAGVPCSSCLALCWRLPAWVSPLSLLSTLNASVHEAVRSTSIALLALFGLVRIWPQPTDRL